MNRRIIAAVIVMLACCAVPANAADPYYKGKTINFIVGYAPGGGSDLTCRVFANHMGRYIDGNPTIVVKNMPGASGANAANYVGEAARPDGLTALCGTISFALSLLEDRALRVDFAKFNYIVGVADSQVFYVRSDVKPGIKNAIDIFNAENLIYGGFFVSSTKDLSARPALNALGLKYKYVTGINGDGAGRTAVQQNFVNAWMEGLASFVSITDPTLVKTGVVVPIFQSGLPDQNGEITQRDIAAPTIPTFMDLYKEKFGKPPSGMDWDVVKLLLGSQAVAQRALALAPNAPPEAVQALRAATDPMLQDPKFREEAERVMGLGVQAFPGERVAKVLQGALTGPAETRAYIKELVESGSKATRN
jgi:tripartite-type tricarboxylate transporter receptor subunit TctC